MVRDVSNAAKSKAKTSAKAAKRTKKSETEVAPKDKFQADSGPKTVKVSYLPQDPGMIPGQIAQVKANPDLSNDRFKVSVGPGYPQPKPDAEGNFITQDLDDPRFDVTQTFFIANQSLEMAERYADRKLEWAFEESLGHPMLLRPHAGKGVVNAYYNPQSGSLNFFSYLDEASGVRQRTGMSADIIAHETGHAILDGMRPNYIQSLSVGGGGFHETFADMTAMLSALNDEHVVEALRLQTKGDLTQPNLVSGIGEELGKSVFGRGPLREAINNHKYADQAFLPYSDPSDPGSGLGTECHSYSNLFNGAFYELFATLYDQASSKPDSTFAGAVAEARDKVGTLLMRSVEMGPVGDTSYREAAMAFVRADLVDNEGENIEALAKVFMDRKILRAEDIEKVIESQTNLPALRWSERLTKEETASKWLDKNRADLGLPEGVQFDFERVRTSNKGERFVTFTTHRDMLLEGPSFGDYEGSQIRSQGGVLLAFDAEGDLKTFQYDEVSDRELEDTVNFFQGSLRMGQVARATGEGESLTKKAPPKLQIESVMENGRRVLRRGGVV